MVGIESFGAYIPRYRLKRDEIAKALGVRSQGGERAACDFDEDSLTLSVEALTDAMRGMDPGAIDGLFVASTTFPYREKSSSSLIAAVLDLRQRTFTADFTGSLRCGTTAMRAATDAIAAGSAQSILVSAADTRMGDPYSDMIQSLGDAAAAILLGNRDPVASIEHSSFLTQEFTDYWRKWSDQYVQFDDPAFATRYGFLKTMGTALQGVLSESGTEPSSFTRVVYNAPDMRSHQELARTLGFQPNGQVQDPLFQNIGNSGCAAGLICLVAALQDSREGDLVLFANYGDGCDAFILRVQAGIESVKERVRGVKGHLARRKEMDFGKFVSFRKLLK